MELLKGMITGCGEGNVSWYPERIHTIKDLITQHKPKNIIEIGFNEGHSALLICNTLVELIQEDNWYNASPIRLFIFDICKYECSMSNFEIIANHFRKWNIHLHMVQGDSLSTVPRTLDTIMENFDFIEIDGCHLKDCVYNDIINTYGRLNENGILYVDDFNSTKDPHPEIDDVVKGIDWEGFNTYNIDGAFWAQKQSKQMEENTEQVNHPQHYGGSENDYEAIKVIDAWDLGFSLGNTVKYISRAGKKNKEKELEDLKKALWYLQHHIDTLKNK
jgi:predicted O-methyltransferase YrrM